MGSSVGYRHAGTCVEWNWMKTSLGGLRLASSITPVTPSTLITTLDEGAVIMLDKFSDGLADPKLTFAASYGCWTPQGDTVPPYKGLLGSPHAGILGFNWYDDESYIGTGGGPSIGSPSQWGSGGVWGYNTYASNWTIVTSTITSGILRLVPAYSDNGDGTPGWIVSHMRVSWRRVA